MSKNNTMTNMYRTILLALPALLLLAACADDVTTPAEPADTLAGQPVRFTATGLAITPAGVTQTKADADFTTMTVYMTDTDGNTWQADYSNASGTWQAVGEPLYWPTSTDQYTFTAISPKGTDPHITLPTAWTAEDLTTYEAIRATYGEEQPTKPTKDAVSLTLRPALTKVQVVSISGQPVYLIDAPTAGTLDLTNSTTGNAATGIMTLCPKDDLTYEGYVLPAGEAAGFSFLTDNVYTVKTELTAGTVVTTWDDTEAVLINCRTPGGLEDVWPNSTPEKVVITGTLDYEDLEAISKHKDEIVELYVMGGLENDYLHFLNMGSATQLESVYLAEAGNIGTGAFSSCNKLASVSLPKAEDINNSAFQGCGALESICLPQATDIGQTAFFSCKKLTSISLPLAKSIGANAFVSCDALTSICLSKDASIGTNAFQYCERLTTLFLSDENTTEADAEAKNNWGGITWQAIYYGYQGTGDYLDPANYEGCWPETTN